LIATVLLHQLANTGLRVVGMKPVAAGVEVDGRWADVTALRSAGNVDAPLDLVNPYRFNPPIAPHLGAQQVGVTMSIASIALAYQQLSALADVVVVEGAGGWLVPLNETETLADLALALNVPIILVVGMRLGCINHALLTVAAIQSRGLHLAGWVANCIDADMPQFNENLQCLTQRIPAPLLGSVPFLAGMDLRQLANHIQLDKLRL
jgi:dethiobiotin synthetase